MEKVASTLTAPQDVQESWPKPNYVDPETRGRALEYVSIAFSAFGLAVVLLRCYSRLFLTRAFGLDDALIILALVLCVALAVLLIYGIEQWYLGYHIWDLPALAVVHHRRGMWIASYINVCASTCIRISILLFYRRLSISFSRTFLIATWIGIAYNLGFALGFCLTNTFICYPTRSFWLRYDIDWRYSHDWHCGNEAFSLPISAAMTVVADLYSTILPLALVVTLKIPRKQKLALYWLFGLGFLACGACLVRAIYLSWSVLRTYDFTWRIYDVWIWNNAELFIGIFAASAPAMKPLIRNLMGMRFLGYSYTNSSGPSHRNRPQRHAQSNGPEGKGNVIPVSWDTWTEEVTSTKQKDLQVSSRAAQTDESDFNPPSRMSSIRSIVSSINSDKMSTESFPPRPGRQARKVTIASPIPEGANEWSNHDHHSEVEVDPPIYPDIVLSKPKRSNGSLRVAVTETPQTSELALPYSAVPGPLHNQEGLEVISAQSLPAAYANQNLGNSGWVELQPVKPGPAPVNSLPFTSRSGSVRAARLRALNQEERQAAQPSPSGSARIRNPAQNHPRAAQPSPSNSIKPYFDAESNHATAIEPRPIVRPVYTPSACLSDDMTRLDLSNSSSDTVSVEDHQLHGFDLGLDVVGPQKEEEVTALPTRTGSKASQRHR